MRRAVLLVVVLLACAPERVPLCASAHGCDAGAECLRGVFGDGGVIACEAIGDTGRVRPVCVLQ